MEEEYARACELEEQRDARCIHAFYEVAKLSCPDKFALTERACELHHSALRKLIFNAQTFGLWDPSRGILLNNRSRQTIIPVHYEGFAWDATDFHRLIAVGDYHTSELDNQYRRSGAGIPYVVERLGSNEMQLMPVRSAFSATVRMSGDGELSVLNPSVVDSVATARGSIPIAKDTSAGLVATLYGKRESILSDFINPEQAQGQSRLYALEPYQAGKTPIVFIHGLLSSPFSWANVVNELRAQPGFDERFQIWLFEYPTGQSFLASAAQLRTQLQLARQSFDPHHSDRQFSNMVLIGHSLGGLIAKLQVTESSDRLWRAASKAPFNNISMSQQARERLTSSFFFEPNCDVQHLIFLGTPHRGSAIANRLIGRSASALVEQPPESKLAHRELIDSNPGVFSDEVSRRIPTSIDLLEPSSPLLQAIEHLPVRKGVGLHSVIGSTTWTLKLERSDGVVPMSSAQHSGVLTESVVRVSHGRLNDHEDVVNEVTRILQQHVDR